MIGERQQLLEELARYNQALARIKADVVCS